MGFFQENHKKITFFSILFKKMGKNRKVIGFPSFGKVTGIQGDFSKFGVFFWGQKCDFVKNGGFSEPKRACMA